ncbi:MAG: DUF1223 domain-containing protein [Kiloniellales bacterium]
MRKSQTKLTACAAIASLLLLAGLAVGPLGWTEAAEGSAQSSSSQAVVVELFTSQGCSSCPPADAFLTELAREPGVIALSLHVDYWNYIGWTDPFSSPVMTARQQDYAHSLSSRYVYTPQMVIDGQHEVVGSRRSDARSLIAAAAARPKPLTLRYQDDASGDAVVIPAGDAPAEPASIWLAVYDAAHETEVLRGENKGKSLRHSNVVRELEHIGNWDGRETVIPIDTEALAARGRDGCAVIVQAGKGGPVLGAIALDMDD